jgi:hypothetical protein
MQPKIVNQPVRKLLNLQETSITRKAPLKTAILWEEPDWQGWNTAGFLIARMEES